METENRHGAAPIFPLALRVRPSLMPEEDGALSPPAGETAGPKGGARPARPEMPRRARLLVGHDRFLSDARVAYDQKRARAGCSRGSQARPLVSALCLLKRGRGLRVGASSDAIRPIMA